jgi:hypothetical protein
VVNKEVEGPSNVISMLSRRKTMIYGALSQVEGYWEAARTGVGVPPRSAIDPRGIEDALEYAFILDCVAPGVARFRLAGMHLTDLMGMEVRGMPVTAMFTPQARKTLGTLICEVCTQPQVSQIVLQAERSIGRPALEARMLLAPLTDDFGEVNRILGCLQSNGSIGRQPRRFSIGDVATRLLSEASRAAVAKTETVFSEDPGLFIHPAERKRPDAARPALRVVSSED